MTIAFFILLEKKNSKYKNLYDRGQKIFKEQLTSLLDLLLEDYIHKNMMIEMKLIDNLDNKEGLYVDNWLYMMFE
jgi:hypothetical protein